MPGVIPARHGGFLKGCLVAVGALVLLLIVGGVVLYMNRWKLAAKGVSVVVEACVSASGLSQAEKDRAKALSAKLVRGLESGVLKPEALPRILTSFAGAMMYSQCSQALNGTAFSDADREAGRKTLSRYFFAVGEGTFEPMALEGDAQAPVPEELRAALKRMEEALQGASAPAPPAGFDSDEMLRQAIAAAEKLAGP